MTRCRLLLQKLTGHISEVSNQSMLNFGVVWFFYVPNMCANFQKKSEGYRLFVVDLVWNDPCKFHSSHRFVLNLIAREWHTQLITPHTLLLTDNTNFNQKRNQYLNEKKLENLGIDPSTFCMLSRHSTIWVNYPQLPY